jgi:catechol 2,3-dioxygenase-like lactoylglutathione lyase family enzyme
MAVNGIFYVSVYVSDLERSKRFYGELLGWKLGTDEEAVAGYHFGSSYLVVLADNRSKDAGKYSGGMHVAVKVSDVAAEHRRLKTLNGSVGDLVEQPWGEKSFSITDPDGYSWSFSQDPESAA